jgi:Glycosyl hydrolase family 76
MPRLCRAIALAGLLLAGFVTPARASQAAPDEAALRFGAAVATQTTMRKHLRVLGDAFDCTDARLVAYRRSTEEPELTDQWYVASQLLADATLLIAAQRLAGAQADGWNADDAQCHVDKGFNFLDRLWDYSGAGYYARSNPVGTRVDDGPRFGDDNALGGLALLMAREATSDPQVARRYLHAAQREADFLRGSQLWDDTFGGGFWWNTGRGDSPEGKPAQTNSLAALFFAELYAVTGNPDDREWALRALLWLDTVLYDPIGRAYRWSVAFRDIPNRSGAMVSDRYFSYDQSIGLQAQLAGYALDRDAGRLERARAMGASLTRAFWSEELGGFNLEAGVEQVYTGFSAWSSLGQLALADIDTTSDWLAQTRATATALAARLRAPDGGYGTRAYVCVDRVARGCESGQVRIVVDTTVDGAAEAWAQLLETALAVRLAQPQMP